MKTASAQRSGRSSQSNKALTGIFKFTLICTQVGDIPCPGLIALQKLIFSQTGQQRIPVGGQG